MTKEKRDYRKMTTKHFMEFFNVQERQAIRKRMELRLQLNMAHRAPIYFKDFCIVIKRPPDELATFFGWQIR